MLDAVKSKSHRAGGKSVFPFKLIRIHLRGVPEAKYFPEENKSGLTRASYRFPEDFELEIHSTLKLPEPGEEWL